VVVTNASGSVDGAPRTLTCSRDAPAITGQPRSATNYVGQKFCSRDGYRTAPLSTWWKTEAPLRRNHASLFFAGPDGQTTATTTSS